MRTTVAAIFALLVATPAFAQSQVACSQIPQAQSFVDGLKPGPNTKAAQAHLDAAKAAKSDKECVSELGKVNYYAKRSAAADKRMASAQSGHPAARHPLCADAAHQNRPGGSDYHGPPVAGCKPVI